LVDCFVHSLQARLSRANQVLVSNNLIHELLLGQRLHLLLAVRSIVLPSLEPAGERVLQVIKHELAGATDSLPLLDVVLPRVHRLGNHRELRILEEQSNNTLLHVVLLRAHLAVDVLLDCRWRIPCVDQVLLHRACIAHILIAAHHDATLSIHSVGNAVAFLLVVPSLEIVTQTVGTAMHEHTTQVFLFEVLLLSTVA